MFLKKLLILVFITFVVNIFPCAFAQTPGNTTPKTIVVLGSSTSYGYLASPIDSSYVSLLSADLHKYHRGDTIINLASPGYTTYEIQPTGSVPSPDTGSIADPDTLRNVTYALKFHPNLVIINMPTNDIADNYTNAQSINNYKQVVNLLIAAHVQYIITSTQPRNFTAAQRARLRPFTNLLISNFPGHVVDYLDQLSNADYTIRDSLSGGDGIHVNNKGHFIIFNAIVNFSLYKQLVNFTQVISCNNFTPVLYGSADYTPAASTTSNLPLTYTSSNPGVATIVNGKIHVLTKGTTNITITQGGNGTYAAATPLVESFVVNPAPLTIKAQNRTKVYGAANPGFSVTYTGFVNGDDTTKLTTKPQIATTALASSPKGSYPITASLAADSNYSFTYVAGGLSITPAALTIKADDKTRLYGVVNPSFSATYTGFVNGDDTTKLVTKPHFTAPATQSSPIGTYKITAAAAADSNYTITYTTGNLTITPASLLIKPADKTKQYGSPNPALTVIYAGFVNGDDSTKLVTKPHLSTTALLTSPIGNYPVTASAAVDSNYTISYTAGNLSVTKAALLITANNQTKQYGLPNPTLTVSYTGFVNGDDTTRLVAKPHLITTALLTSPVGTYPITASAAADSNYTISYSNGNLSVTKAVLTITANNQTKQYGLPNPALNVSYTGFVNGDDSTKLATRPIASTTAVKSSPAGSYPITASGAVSANYTFNYNPGSLSITPASLTVTAGDNAKIYGAANPLLTISYTGFVNGDDSTKLTTRAVASTTATASSPVGAYPITVGGATSSNYIFTYTQGNLNITAASLTVKANNATKTYGAPNPALGFTYTGFVNGDDATKLTVQPLASTTATASSSAGSYPINVSGAASSNYSFSYVPGNLSVTTATITITANNATKTYGADNPALGLSYTGFVNGDDTTRLSVRAIASTTASRSSAVGTYPITAGGAASPNYSFSYVSGSLNILRAQLTVRANNVTKALAADNPVLDISYSGFVNGDDLTSLVTQASVSTTANASSPVGTYPISVSGASSLNYTFNYIPGILTVSSVPAPTISGISPANAKAGTTVTITGSNFGDATGVTFGGVPATSFTVVSPTVITAVVGAGSASGDISVTTPTGTIIVGGFTYVYDLPQANFKLAITSATCKDTPDGSVNITASENLNYTATITGNGLNTPYPFTKNLTINELAAGTYSVCITVSGQSGYSQCYDVVITEPKDLSVYSVINNDTNTININLSGGDQYNIQLNGAQYATRNSQITLPVKQGNNELSVVTDKLCQGVFQKTFNASGKITPYPIPFQNTLNLNLGNDIIRNVIIQIRSLPDGKLVYTNQYNNQSGVLQLDLSRLDNGVYALQLVMDDSEKIFKVIKQ